MNHLGMRSWVLNHPARTGTLAGWYQQICGLVATAVTMPFILNPTVLTPAESGVWLTFQSTLGLINLTDFGLSLAISRQVAYSFPKGDSSPIELHSDFIETDSGWAGVAAVFEAGRRLFNWLGVAAGLLIVVIYELVLPLGHLLDQRNSSINRAWYLLGAATLISLQCKLYQGVVDGLGLVYIGRFIFGTSQILSGVLVVTVLRMQPDLTLLGAVLLAVSVIQFFAYRVTLFAVTKGRLRKSADIKPIPLQKVWNVAMPIGLVNSGAFLVSCIQVPLLGSVLGSVAVAPFYLAQRIGQFLMTGLLQLLSPQLPLFTHQVALGRQTAAVVRMRQTMFLVAAAALVVFATYYTLSPLVVRFWVGQRRYVDTTTLLILACDYFMMTVAVGHAHFVLSSGRNPFVVTTLLAGGLNTGLCFYLIGDWGILGIAIAGLIAGLVTNYWFAIWQGFKLLANLSKVPSERQIQPVDG